MNKHMGSTLDSLFDELGEREDVEILTQKKLLADQIRRQMTASKVSKAALARRMRTSRTEIYHLLDPKDTGVTLATVAKASRALGMEFALMLKPTRRVRLVSKRRAKRSRANTT